MRTRVYNRFLDESQLLDERALTFIVSQEDPMEVADRVLEGLRELEDPPLVVSLHVVKDVLDIDAEADRPGGAVIFHSSRHTEATRLPSLPSDLGGAVAAARPRQGSSSVPVPRPTVLRSRAKRIARECQVDVLLDITGNSTCSGCISDFAKYFQNRFERIKRLLVHRREMLGAVPVAAAGNRTGEVRTVGMVVERQSTTKGGVVFELEDQSGRMKVLSTGGPKTPVDIVTDEVVGVIGTLNPSRDLVYAEQVVRPDIPAQRRGNRTDRDLHVAFAADIHVGSKTFLDTQWTRFMDFLNGRLDSSNGVLDTLELLVIPGDVVDGIGVFPNHQEELLITDIYEQYEMLAELLKDVPDHIKVIMTPGNHDAVRLAEPQPALSSEVRKMFAGKVQFLGNPALLDVEGVRILAYHGKSIDDFVTHVQGCTYEDPVTVMKEMLKRRHLAPIYGGRTSIAPEAEDHLVIETIPDVFATGHVHMTGVEQYRGTLLVNASAWQAQTRYQRSMNFVPDPAKVPIVNLRDMSTKVYTFAS